MRYLLDKNVVRHCVRGLLGDLRQDDVRFSLHLLLAPGPGELFISLETVHILEHIVSVPQRRVVLRRTSHLFPTRYTRRWARRLREANFDREDAYLLSLATFGTDRLKEGRILAVCRRNKCGCRSSYQQERELTNRQGFRAFIPC